MPTTSVQPEGLAYRGQHHAIDRQNPMNASLHFPRAWAANFTIFSFSRQKSSEAAERFATHPYTQGSSGRWTHKRNTSRMRRRTRLRTTALPILRGVAKNTSPESPGSRGRTSKRRAASFRRLPDAKKSPISRLFRIVFVAGSSAGDRLSAGMAGKFALYALGNESVSAFCPATPEDDPPGPGAGSLQEPVLPYSAPLRRLVSSFHSFFLTFPLTPFLTPLLRPLPLPSRCRITTPRQHSFYQTARLTTKEICYLFERSLGIAG